MKIISRFGGNYAAGLAVVLLLGALIAGSRSFMLGAAAALCYTLLVYYGKWQVKRYLLAAMATILLLGSLLSFLVKMDSSRGRMLVYKITTHIIRDHPFTGAWPQTFASVYGQYQLDYFKEGHYTEKELLLADNTKYAFNDYLQWIAACGIPGLMIVLCMAACMGWLLRKGPVLVAYKQLFLSGAVPLVTIVVAACFTHVYERIWAQLLAVVSLTVVLYSLYPAKRIYFLGIIACGGLLMARFGHQLYFYETYKKLEEANDLGNMGYLRRAEVLYSEAYPTMQHDPAFLADYVHRLRAVQDYSRALQVLAVLMEKDKLNIFFSMAGECYEALGQYAKAEEALQNAVYRVPNRFGTRYDLFEFYRRRNYSRKAKETGAAILALPVKIPSSAVDTIRERVRSVILAEDIE